jgi:endoglucanase
MWGTWRRLEADEGKKRPRRGVSLAGSEFGAERAGFSNAHPGICGRDYIYNSEATIAYFCALGLNLLRLPLRWERLQPRLGAELDATELERVRRTMAWAKAHGGQIILDIHNYGRYVIERNGRSKSCVIDEKIGDNVPVSRSDFADLWARLARSFRGESAVAAYALMNEPHDMGNSSWPTISQAAVSAIRRHDDGKLIIVPGDRWSNSFRFGDVNGPRAWIQDPANHIAYEAHCYFDADSSGQYVRDYSDELSHDAGLESRGAKRLLPFARWCQSNRVRGFLGEFGIPAREERWKTVLAQFLDELDRAEMDGCYWAAGEWWGSYPMSIQPGKVEDGLTPAARVLTRS